MPDIAVLVVCVGMARSQDVNGMEKSVAMHGSWEFPITMARFQGQGMFAVTIEIAISLQTLTLGVRITFSFLVCAAAADFVFLSL